MTVTPSSSDGYSALRETVPSSPSKWALIEDLKRFAGVAAQMCQVGAGHVVFLETDREPTFASWGEGTIDLPALSLFVQKIADQPVFLEVDDVGCEPEFLNFLEPQPALFAAVKFRVGGLSQMGLLCVADQQPGRLSSGQVGGLQGLARLVERYLEGYRYVVDSLAVMTEQQIVLEESRSFFSFLIELGDATRGLSAAEEILKVTCRLLCQHLGTSRCAYAEVEDDHNQFAILHDHTVGCETTVGSYQLEDFGEHVTHELQSGRTVVISNIDKELQPEMGGDVFDGLGIKAIVVCPLCKESGLRALMAVHQTTARIWTGSEIHLVQEVVERCWSSIERARAELRVQQSRIQFHDLFEFAPDAIVMTNSRGEITLLNQQAEKLFGYSRDELIGRPIEILMPTSAREKHVELRGQFYEEASLRAMGAGGKRLMGLRKDGREFPVDISLSPLQVDGGLGVAAAIRDVTEREQVQNRTLRTQRLESIGTLAGGVAHDLNNALAPILMAIELLRLENPGADDLIDTIEQSAQRGGAMVRQLLTFAKGIEGERRLLEPLRVLDEMERVMSATFPKQLQIHTSFAPDLHCVVGDLTQLHQVLLNLCVNARDAMPGGGILTLQAENIEIDEAYASSLPDASPGSYVVWSVRDTGPGIPNEVLERIFEPFFSTKAPEQGTGLGLSTVLGIVKGHGGFLEVYSRLGYGTTFYVYLRAAVDMSVPQEPSKPMLAEFRGNGETILVVDDEKAIRLTASRVLESMNFTVLSAADGTEALILAAENRADIRAVFTDLHMPHIDGVTLAQALIQMLPGCGIAIMSGRLDEREMKELRNLGISMLLSKPFTRQRMTEALKALLDPSTQR